MTNNKSVAVELLTPYGASRLVNAALEAAGATKRVPSQMLYNYTKQRVNAGKKPLIDYTDTEGVSRESLATWIESYVAKQLAKDAASSDTDEQVSQDA